MTEPERDESGQFASTALTRTRDAAIAELGEEAVFAMVAGAAPMREIADALGLDGKDYNARRAVYQWLRRPENRERYEEAKAMSAEVHAELAGEVYGETEPLTAAGAKWRNDRSGWHRWMAETRDPSLRRAGVEVNVDVAALHMEALKAGGSMDLNPDFVREVRGKPDAASVLREQAIREAEFEVEEGDEDGNDD